MAVSSKSSSATKPTERLFPIKRSVLRQRTCVVTTLKVLTITMVDAESTISAIHSRIQHRHHVRSNLRPMRRDDLLTISESDFAHMLNLPKVQNAIGVDLNYSTFLANEEVYFAFQQTGDFV